MWNTSIDGDGDGHAGAWQEWETWQAVKPLVQSALFLMLAGSFMRLDRLFAPKYDLMREPIPRGEPMYTFPKRGEK